MCGLVGFYTSSAANDAELQLFKNLLLVDQIRGMHATGVAKVDVKANSVAIHKMAHDAVDYLAHPDTKTFLDGARANIYIGHNRFATMGNKTDHDNAHPFQQDHITLAHNGGVDHWGLDLLSGQNVKGVEVDSHMVTMTIAEHGIRKAVTEKLSGDFALVWWDSKERSLNFIRNRARPLWMAVTSSGNLVWASERAMLDMFLKRVNKPTGYRMEPTELMPNKHHKFLFNEQGYRVGTVPTVVDMEFLDLPSPKWSGNWTEWYGADYPDTYTSQRSNVSNSGNKSATVTDINSSAALRNVQRVDKALKDRGSPYRHGDTITLDLVRLEAYATNPKFCRAYCIERETKVTVEMWSLDLEQMRKYSKFRATVTNAFINKRLGEEEFVITADKVYLSCLDKAFNGNQIKIRTQHDVIQESRPAVNPDFSDPKYTSRTPIRYPLKTNGHTFQTAMEFSDFARKGCAVCLQQPTPYDRRNHKLSVIAGNNFTGLLEECDFICGQCEEEGS